MMLTGLRVGEALAIRPEKIDLRKRTLLIDAQLTGTPKDNEARRVDLPAQLVTVLSAVIEARSKTSKVVAISGESQGQQPVGPWLFYPELGSKPTGKDEYPARERDGRER